MNSSLSISRSGLKGLQTQLDVTSNNIANVNTNGYKQKNTNFSELLRNDVINRENEVPNGISRGLSVSQAQYISDQGSLTSSTNPFDLAISGEGFFGIRLNDNQLVYTRDGNFTMDAAGDLRNSAGNLLDVNYTVPRANWPEGKPNISEIGQITVNGALVGNIPVYDSELSGQLMEIGNNQLASPDGTQMNRLANPFIKQNFLEASNVDLANSMADMIVTQRAYSMNAKVLQSTDEMMQRINEFKQ